MREPQVKPTWKDDRWARRLGRGLVVLRLEVSGSGCRAGEMAAPGGRFVGWRGRLQRGRGRCPGREAASAGGECRVGAVDPGELRGRHRRAPDWRVGPLFANRGRVAAQLGVAACTVAKAVVIGAASGVTAGSRTLGKKLEAAEGEPVEGGTDPSPTTSRHRQGAAAAQGVPVAGARADRW
jgi:hypothetical protein